MSDPIRVNKLWEVETVARRQEYEDPEAARQSISAILPDLHLYDASPTTWHTVAMIAGRVNHYEGRLALIREGLAQWPDDVDLLCEEVQMLSTPTEGYDPVLGEKRWNALVKMNRAKTSPHWRFWVYGAIYLARRKDDPQAALDFLDEGLKHVHRNSLVDIFRSYRRALIDSRPLRAVQSMDNLVEYQTWAFEELEKRLKIGLSLGPQTGYVLAVELAQLYQEKAVSEDNDQNLDLALKYLDVAEKVYTADSNHPIWDIYLSRINILMAQRKYGEALKRLRCLPQQVSADPSVRTMLNLALQMTGESSVGDTEPDGAAKVLGNLFDKRGEQLLNLAKNNSQIETIIKHIASQL